LKLLIKEKRYDLTYYLRKIVMMGMNTCLALEKKKSQTNSSKPRRRN